MKIEISGRGINKQSKYYYKRLVVDIYDRYQYNSFLPEEIEDLLEIGSLQMRMSVMRKHKLIIPDRSQKRFRYSLNPLLTKEGIADTKKYIILNKLANE